MLNSINKVFLYGDSISMQYGYPLLDNLKKLNINYERLGGSNSLDLANDNWNGLSSKKMLEWIYAKKNQTAQHTLLVFNCGLHDIVHIDDSRKCQVKPEEYINNLREIIEQSRKIFFDVVFCNSTPVDDARHNRICPNWRRYNNDVLHYNSLAQQVCNDLNVRIVDLYKLTDAQLKKGSDVYIDHVHVNERMSKLHAKEIIGVMIKYGYINVDSPVID